MKNWEEKARRRDVKRHKAQHGMRTDGNSTKLIQVEKGKRAKH